jgi:hypothetical protein
MSGSVRSTFWNAAPAPPWVLSAGLVGGVILNLVVFAGTIYFFFHCRRVNRKAELEAKSQAATSAG